MFYKSSAACVLFPQPKSPVHSATCLARLQGSRGGRPSTERARRALSQELRKRKLIVSGKKRELAERLLESMQKSAAAGVDGPVREPVYDSDGQEVELSDDLKPQDVDHLTV